MSQRARLTKAESAAGVGAPLDPFGEIDCEERLVISFAHERNPPPDWVCWNVRTREPVEVTEAIKRAMRRRWKAEMRAGLLRYDLRPVTVMGPCWDEPESEVSDEPESQVTERGDALCGR